MNQQQAGQPRLTPDDQETAVLLSLAYLGQLTLAQLARLLLTSERTIQRRLTQDADSLTKRGLITRIDRAGVVDDSGMPSRGVAWWRLTEEGHRHIRTHAQYPSNSLGHDEQYPARPAAIRKGRLQHDSLVAETVVCLVEAARAQGRSLSGVFARLELKLNPFHSAPWADALVVCHTSQEQSGSHPTPWTRNMATGAEDDWAFVVELDRATEPLATIGGKAREYATMMGDQRWKQHWTERFGSQLPRILWVVPNAQRGEQVQRVWQEHWPEGRWYIATPEQLRSNSWQRSLSGERETVRFFKLPKSGPTGAAQSPQSQLAVAGQSTQGAQLSTTSTAPPRTTEAVPSRPVATGGAQGVTPDTTFRVSVLLTSLNQTFAPNDKCAQLLDEAGRVLSETTLQLGRANFRLPSSEQAMRLRLPELQVEVKLGAGHNSIDLQIPEPLAPDLPSRRRHDDEPYQWSNSAFERAIDQAYHACDALSRSVNKQSDEFMQRTVGEGGAGRILLGLLLAYLSIFPVGLSFVGQALCVLLRVFVRLTRAISWTLSTVWKCAWSKPDHPVLTGLARLLLALVFVVWLPIATWSYYNTGF